MINLLPEEGKRWLRVEYALRLARIALLLVAFLALAGGALLAPSYLLSREQRADAEASRATLSHALQEGMREKAAEELALAQTLLRSVESAAQERHPSSYIEELVKARTGGVVLERFHFERRGSDPLVRLGGTAKSRESLIAFTQALEGLGGVKAVDLPVSNLTRSVNVPFTLTVLFEKSP